MKVIVTDSKYKMTLAPVRALAKEGYRVLCCDYESTPERERLGALSRYCAERTTLPEAEGALVPALAALGGAGEKPVLFPAGRRMLDIVARHGALADRLDYLVSPAATLDAADDKGRVRDLARTLGIRVPETRFLSAYESLDRLAEAVRYPCIVKYRNGEALGLHSQDRYAIAADEAAFLRAYVRMDAIQPDPLAQDYLPGQDVGIAVVADRDHRVVDFLCYESLRTYPPEGGPTCLCRTLFDRGLLRSAAALIKALGFTGVAMLDFRRSGGEDYLLEINPRLWGSASLCNVAGSGFFQSYVLAAQGKAEPLDVERCSPGYALGAVMRFTPQNAAAVLRSLRRGERTELLAGVGARDGLFAAGDAKPYFAYLMNLLRHSGDA